MSRHNKLQGSVRTTVAASLATATLLILPSAPAQAATQDVELWAVQNNSTYTLPGTSGIVPVWGYSFTNSPIAAPGGPTIEVTQGDTVHVTLHNTLGVKTAILFQGQQMPPDLTGADATTGTTEYTFTPSHPGTFIYEAGPVISTGAGTGTQYQTAMGLHGALVVRPAAGGQAYDAASAYDDEAVLVLSEIDPALNKSANPANFDMRKYVPRYSLINGKAYPATAPITSAGGNTVLLRYVNAGVNYHSMGVLGASQKIVGLDGSKLDFPRTYVAQTFGPGESADALVKVPGAAAQDTSLSVYDASQGLNNRMAAGVGGMLTTVDVAGSGNTDDTAGPVPSTVTYLGTTLAAHVDDSERGGSNISAAEYYLDDVTAGTGIPMTVGTSPTEDATATLSLPAGQHVLYVRGQDAASNWGPLSSVLVTGADAGGPTTSGPTLSPRLIRPTGGTVAISATGNDSASGNSPIAAGEYFIDPPTDPAPVDGSGTSMTVSQSAPIASLDAVIPASVVSGLSEGGHVVSIHSQDAPGSWGLPVTVELVVDATGPTIDSNGLVIAPNPTNGLVPFSNGTSSIRLTAAGITDPLSGLVNSPVGGGEVFIDQVGATGTGIPLRAVDGAFSSTTEGGYIDIPLTTVRALASGNHTISVRAKDAAGNWGELATTILLVDKVGPSTTNATASPSPTQGARTVTLTATGTDALSSIAAGEFFLGTDPGVGKGTAMTASGSGTVTGTLDTSVLPEGTVTGKVRTKDAAGNWGATTNVTVSVTAPLSFSTVTTITGAGGRNANNVYRWTGAAMAAGTVYSGPGNVDGYAVVDATHVYVSFSGTTTVPGLGNVPDEDVVSYNPVNGTYTRVFDGSTNGLGGNGVNVDAVSVSGGKLYYSVNGTTRPNGAAGGTTGGANNDIYRYDGTGVTGSSTRVVDASAAPYSMPNSDVDGLKFIDATHFYLSFSPTTTTLSGLGNVQDEDVVAFNAGRWSVYFDGTSKGLTNNNSDIDAFDLP